MRYFAGRALGSPIARRILSFGELPAGWHYGSGVPAPLHVIDNALRVGALLTDVGAKKLEAFPEIVGGILVSGYHDADTVDVLCRVDRLFDICHEEDNREIANQEGISFQAITQYLQE